MEAKAPKEMALVDTISSHVFDNNPSAKDIIKNQGFEIVAIDPSSPQKYSNYFVKCNTGHNKGRFVPLEEYAKSQGENFMQMLKPSELYENTYFELGNFNGQYWEEYEYIVNRFGAKLGGGTEIKVCYSKKELEEYKKNNSTNAKVNANYKAVQVKADYENSDNQTDTKEKTHDKEITLQSFQPKCTKEEIVRWIEEERINIAGLPNQLKTIIKEFLESEHLKITYKDRKEIVETIKNTQNTIHNIQVKIEVFPAALRSNISRSLESTSEKSTKTEVYLYLHCKHDGA